MKTTQQIIEYLDTYAIQYELYQLKKEEIIDVNHYLIHALMMGDTNKVEQYRNELNKLVNDILKIKLK